MQTIDIRWKTIEDAAVLLAANAPARGDYYGTPLRARYATTRPADIVAQYNRTIEARALAYGNSLSLVMRARMVCGHCGAKGCKMWREYQTCSDYTKILCGPCALKDQKKTGVIDAGGYIRDEEIGGLRCDQIGWMAPAVPTSAAEEDTFWGYTSVPEPGVRWWRNLPSYPR